MRIMCKSKSVDQDKSQTIETSNYGFLNLSEDNLGMGIREILLMVFLIMAVIMTWVYCVNRNKQRRMRELSSAIIGWCENGLFRQKITLLSGLMLWPIPSKDQLSFFE